MPDLTLEEIARRIDSLSGDVAEVIRKLGKSPSRAYAAAVEPIAIPASEVARMLSIKRDEVYTMHHAGVLNGFRPYPRSHLQFLVSEVRELAQKMSEERRDA
jgi:hypothetical protein